jgi:hypothetical protein
MNICFSIGDTVSYARFAVDLSSGFNIEMRRYKGFVSSLGSLKIGIISERSEHIVDAIAIFDSTRVILIEKKIFKEEEKEEEEREVDTFRQIRYDDDW